LSTHKNLFYSFEVAANNSFFLDEFYYVVVDFFLYSAYIAFELIEKGFLELLGPLVMTKFNKVITMQSKVFIFSGKIYNYFCLTIIGLLLWLLFLLY
jgi:hypothetical protein